MNPFSLTLNGVVDTVFYGFWTAVTLALWLATTLVYAALHQFWPRGWQRAVQIGWWLLALLTLTLWLLANWH